MNYYNHKWEKIKTIIYEWESIKTIIYKRNEPLSSDDSFTDFSRPKKILA